MAEKSLKSKKSAEDEEVPAVKKKKISGATADNKKTPKKQKKASKAPTAARPKKVASKKKTKKRENTASLPPSKKKKKTATAPAVAPPPPAAKADLPTSDDSDVGSPPPSYAALVGMCSNESPPEELKAAMYIRTIPAVLGRRAEGDDSSKGFLPLAGAKRLSRRQAEIFWWDAAVEALGRGRASQYRDRSGRGARDEESDDEEDSDGDDRDAAVRWAGGEPEWGGGGDDGNEDDAGYRSGFVVRCRGKNSIVVDGTTVRKGECAPLSDGSTLRIANYRLYFVLPLDARLGQMIVPNPAFVREGDGGSGSVGGQKRAAAAEKMPDAKKKGGNEDEPERAKKKKKISSLDPPGKKDRKALVAEDLDHCTLAFLFERMDESVATKTWDRKDQLVGSAIAIRAVRDAATSRSIRALAAKESGATRSDIIEWIHRSKKYSQWARQMQKAMEVKSYHTNIGKALIKTGYEKTGTMGRSVKWALPALPSDGGTGDEGGKGSVPGSDGDGSDEEDGSDDGGAEGDGEKEEEEEDEDGGASDESSAISDTENVEETTAEGYDKDDDEEDNDGGDDNDDDDDIDDDSDDENDNEDDDDDDEDENNSLLDDNKESDELH